MSNDDSSAADRGSGLSDQLGPLPEPDLQADPCNADGTQTDYYTAGTVRRLLAAERERCAVAAWNHYMDTCRKTGRAPAMWNEWCASDAIRKA